jgi:hypothetical protein
MRRVIQHLPLLDQVALVSVLLTPLLLMHAHEKDDSSEPQGLNDRGEMSH